MHYHLQAKGNRYRTPHVPSDSLRRLLKKHHMSEENGPQATRAVPNHYPRQILTIFSLVGYTEEAASSFHRRAHVPFISLSLKCPFLQETPPPQAARNKDYVTMTSKPVAHDRVNRLKELTSRVLFLFTRSYI